MKLLAPEGLERSHAEYKDLMTDVVARLRKNLGEFAENDERVKMFESKEYFADKFSTTEDRDSVLHHLKQVEESRKEMRKNSFLGARLFGHMMKSMQDDERLR